MKQEINILMVWIYLLILLSSCSIQNRMTNNSIQKTIKTVPEVTKGEVFFENDLAIMYFQREQVLKILGKEKKSKFMNPCNLKRLESYIDLLQTANGQLKIFKELSEPSNLSNHFEIDFQRHLIEEFSLNSKVALYNKMTNDYVSDFLYKKKGGEWGCCFAGLTFSNGQNFLDTKIWSDLLIIEECDN